MCLFLNHRNRVLHYSIICIKSTRFFFLVQFEKMSRTFAILLLIFLVSSFSKAAKTINNDVDTEEPSADLFYLGGAIFGTPKRNEKLQQWNEESGENPEELGEYAEGDILFPKTTRNGLASSVARWPNGVVPYEIGAIYAPNDLDVIKRAMDIYHKYTCITFRPRLPSDTDYISIVNGNSGCWSSVGRLSGRQEVNLQSPYCTTKVGTPLHELMHALGFLHEQNRWERDDYVTIAWQNIKSGHDNNFQKASKDTTNAFGVPYDYRSVMHYSPNAFSSNGKPTIVPKDSTKNLKMGQREGFSRGDLLKLNNMYGCPERTPGQGTGNGDEIIPAGGSNNNGGGGGLLSFLFQIIN